MMELGEESRETGVIRFEFMVVVMVFGLVAVIILDHVRYYQEYAEKTVMDITVMNIRTGLRFRVAELMLQNRTRDFSLVAQENPVQWLASPPPNYLGELADPKASEIQPGNWYYDLGRRQLVYHVNMGRFFVSAAEGEKAIRYQVVTVAEQTRSDGGSPPVGWVALKLMEPYRWF